jgi:hypothetical protein
MRNEANKSGLIIREIENPEVTVEKMVNKAKSATETQ